MIAYVLGGAGTGVRMVGASGRPGASGAVSLINYYVCVCTN
jgi:hypothetical protein